MAVVIYLVIRTPDDWKLVGLISENMAIVRQCAYFLVIYVPTWNVKERNISEAAS